MNVTKKCLIRVLKTRCCRWYTQKPVAVKKIASEKEDPAFIRNIGILAHIDAGKTTTTERMLFYSGTIRSMGEVHHGNTVTDFMDQERERGITITSASVTFEWKKHTINLLDTPGHIDFTIEVEQTLNVMDGAVIILDGSAGVEAQTLTVWKQANRYKIPRLIYVNKMDKKDAEFLKSVNSVEKQLHVTPIVIHLPIINESESFNGIIDILTLEKCLWSSNEHGIKYIKEPLSDKDGKLLETAVQARIKLTETLADLDDKVAEIIITNEKKLQTLQSSILKDSIRRVTLEQKGFPVLCGSSYKNIGVQLLMDAVNDYLPSPLCSQSGKMLKYFQNNLCARAFKVRHDNHKGAVTFFRIYSGSLKKKESLYNVKKKKTEQCGRLYVAYADDYEEVSKVTTGNIAAVTGLKFTSCGDLIVSSESVFSSAQKAISSSKNLQDKELFSSEFCIPEPVFFCSIEAPSLSLQSALDKALSELTREDPSLKVNVNSETGQTVLGGMGELHLEVITERIRKEYKLEIETGPILIAYKEALIEDAKETFAVEHNIGNTRHSVKIILSVLRTKKSGKERLLLDKSPECAVNISSIFPKHLLAVKNGVESALSSGPRVYCPVVNVSVMLHHLEVGKGTSDSIITSVTSQSVRKLLKKGGTKILEPIMVVNIVCSDKILENIINDLSKRRAEIIDTDSRGLDLVVKAFVPLSELLGYATDLRILSSGKAAFSMEFYSYREMDSEQESKAIKSVFGFN